jgi:O-antigen ligase
MPSIRALAMAVVAGLSTFEPALTLAFGPMVAAVVLLTGRPSRLRVTAPLILAVLFVLWSFMSLNWTPVPEFTSETVILWAQIMVIFIAVYDLIRTQAHLRVVAAGFIAGAAFTVVRHLYFGPEIDGTLAAGGRVVLGNANVNYVAYALATALSVIVLLWVTRTRTKASFLLLGAATVPIVLGLVVSDTRGAQLGAACMLAWIVFCRIMRRAPIQLLISVVLIAAFCIATGVADAASLAYESGSRVTGDWSGRLIIWPLARDAWADSPVIGIGAGAFTKTNGLGVGAHNIILQTGTGLGLVGVALLVALLWTALAWRRNQAAPHQAMLVGALVTASSPAYLSGMWEAAPAAWVGVALFARASVVVASPRAVKPEEEHVLRPRKDLVRANRHSRLIPAAAIMARRC